MELTEKHRQYWNKNLTITTVLLVIWFLVTYGQAWFARDLNAISFFGWPFSFYMSAQGALIIYMLIIGYYAHYINRLDVEFGVQESGCCSPI